MPYRHFLSYANILVADHRLKAYANYYASLSIGGLHYVSFIPSHNCIALCRPDHRTQELATAYLLGRKHGGRGINTVRSQAHDLKLFHDYLSLWQFDLLGTDLFIVLQGFSDFLRLIQPQRPCHAIEWAMVTRVLINKNETKLLGTTQGSHASTESSSGNYSSMAIGRAVWTAADFLKFLQKRVASLRKLSTHLIPHRQKPWRGMISATAGPAVRVGMDIEAIIRDGGIESIARRFRPIPLGSIFSPNEADQFLSAVANKLDLFLFTVLRWFGLRPSELAGLRIEPQSLPDNLVAMEYFEAKQRIRRYLKGDIEFVPIDQTGRWVCRVIDRGNPDYRSGHKSRGRQRDIPWIFDQDIFEDILYHALCERQRILNGKPDHGFIFLRRDHKGKGQFITGKTVEKKYKTITRLMLKRNGTDLTKFRPYTFRHLYATYLIKQLRLMIDDVSRWLGHSSIEMTRSVYCHYLPSELDDRSEGTAHHIRHVLRESLGAQPAR